MSRIHFIFIILIFPGIIQDLRAQKDDNQLALYTFFDSITRIENSDLHSGLIYKEKHRVKSRKSKFFPEPNFVIGSIIFNNQPYFNIPVKYNVFDDELLLRVNKKFGGNILQLHKIKVNGFSIKNHTFIKINDKQLGQGYFEILSKKTAITLLVKHKKSIHEVLDKKLVFYEFEDAKKKYYLAYNNNLYPIEEQTDLSSLFPQHETELISYYNELESELNFESRLKKLIAHLDVLLTSTPIKI